MANRHLFILSFLHEVRVRPNECRLFLIISVTLSGGVNNSSGSSSSRRRNSKKKTTTSKTTAATAVATQYKLSFWDYKKGAMRMQSTRTARNEMKWKN